MRLFFIHLIIAFTAAFTIFKYGRLPIPYNATTGLGLFLAIFFLLWLSSFMYRRSYFRKLPKAINLAFFFIKELLVANLKIAYDIITPRYIMTPTVIALPLTVKTNEEITLLAILISLTPGTLSLDVSDDCKVLYVHSLYVTAHDVELTKQNLKHGFERRILELTT
jgi:multicomponent Na+:H+ antiporter subunit E